MRSFEHILSPYLEIDGIIAAALVSREGFPVAKAGGPELDFTALSAYCASTLASATKLAVELGRKKAGNIYVKMDGRELVLAPLTSDLILLIVGDGAESLRKAGA